MYFVTLPDWEIKIPAFAVFDDQQPTYRWRLVEMRMSTFYYHLHIKPDSIDCDVIGTNILCGTIENTLLILRDYPRSSLSIQVPEWLNSGEPGLYRVIAVYESVDPEVRTYIAECTGGKLYALHPNLISERKKLPAIEKRKLWSHPERS